MGHSRTGSLKLQIDKAPITILLLFNTSNVPGFYAPFANYEHSRINGYNSFEALRILTESRKRP